MTLLSLNDLPGPNEWPSSLGLDVPLDDLLITAAILGLAVAVAVLLHRLAFGILRRANAHGHLGYGEPVFDAVRAPSRWLAVASSGKKRRTWLACTCSAGRSSSYI